MRRLTFALLLLAACATARPGEHAVGFRIIDMYDKLRTLVPGDYMVGRPLRVRVWYPAREGGKAITLREYVGEWEMSGVPPETWRAMVERERRGITAFDRSVAGKLDASPERGRHPLAIYVPSRDETLEEKARVAEHLASHGFVVAVVPRLEDAELRADVRFINVELRGLSDVDENRVTLVSDTPVDEPTIAKTVRFDGNLRRLRHALTQ